MLEFGRYANIHIWAMQSDGFRLRFCLQDQQHSQLQIFHVFFLKDLGPLSSGCQPIHHWMATRILTWKSNLAQWSLQWIDVCQCPLIGKFFFHVNLLQINDVFYHPNSGRSFSQSIFSSKTAMPQCSKFMGKKSVSNFRGKNLKRTRSMAICVQPLKAPIFHWAR